jgi:hypothetical protein
MEKHTRNEMLFCPNELFVVLQGLGALIPRAPFDHGGNPRANVAFDYQAIFCRRRHQPRRPPLAKIRPGLGQRDYGA